MDENSRRRQYAYTGYPQSAHVRGAASTRRTRVGAERFRQAETRYQLPSMRTPPSLPTTSAGVSQAQGLGSLFSSYTQGGAQQYAAQIPDSPLQYHSGGEFSQDEQRSQHFPSFSSAYLYGLQAQVQPAAGYDPVQQYQARQSAGMEVFPGQFVVPQYYNPSENSTGVSGQIAPTAMPSTPYQQQDSQPQSGRRDRTALEASAYAAGMPEYAQIDSSSTIEHKEGTQSQGSGTDDGYAIYLEKLRRTYQEVARGVLVEAGKHLLEITEWLLGHVVDLGLTRDEQELHAQRIQLWEDFNKCWLAVLQRQKDATAGIVELGQQKLASQNVLPVDFLEKMGRELVRLCDDLEQHGLIDYQMGVWEEEIINVLLECLQIFEAENDTKSRTSSLPSGREGSSKGHR